MVWLRQNLVGLFIVLFAAALIGILGLWRIVIGRATANDAAIFELIGGLALGLYAAIRGLRDRRWRRREANWARAEATITRSDIAKTYVWGGGSTTYYKPALVYHFTVGDTVHEGRRLQMDAGADPDADTVRSWIAPFPVGERVMAYYDPADPRRSVLMLDDEGGELLQWAWLCIPVFGTVAAVFAVFGWLGF